MRKFIAAILITIMLLCPLAALAQAPAICTISGVVYQPDGSVAAGAQFRISKISKNGVLISQGPFTYAADGSGNISFGVVRGSTVYIYSTVAPFNVTGGVAVTVPDASTAALASLATVVAVPTTGLTVQTSTGPTTLTNKEGTLWFTGGLKATETTPGIAKVEIDTASSAIVPGTRTITTTNPLRIDGGASADISANRTLTINGLSGLGTANQFVGMNAGASAFEYKSFATGNSGTDFAVAHSAGGITFNLPDASAVNRGAITPGAQTLAGVKTLANLLKFQNATVDVGVWSGTGSTTYLFQGAHSVADSSSIGVGGNPTMALQTTRSGGAQGNGTTVYGFQVTQNGKNDIYGLYSLTNFNSNMSGYAAGAYNQHAGRFYAVGSPTNIPGSANVHIYGLWAQAERTVTGIRPVGIQADCNNNVLSDANVLTSSIDTCFNIATNYTGLAHATGIIYSQGAKEVSAYFGWYVDDNAVAQRILDFTPATATLQGLWTATFNSSTVSGTGGHAAVEAEPGAWLLINGTYARVASATANAITLASPFSGSTASNLTITRSAQAAWLRENQPIAFLNHAGTARKEGLRYGEDDHLYFDYDGVGSIFSGQVKISKTASSFGANVASLLFENPAGTATNLWFTFAGADRGSFRFDNIGNGVWNAFSSNFYFNADLGSAPIFNSPNGAITFADGIKAGSSGQFAVTNAGAATIPTVNKVTITAPAASATLTIDNGKTLRASNSIVLAGTDSTTMTFPATSASLARTDAGQTFTGTQAFGALTATTVNGLAVTTSTGTLTIAGSKTATISNTLTFTGTDSSSVAFGGGGTIGAVGYSAAGQIAATATNDNAASGKVGEYVTSTVGSGSPVTLTNGVAANLTSISLTAGDWEVWVFANFTPAGTVSSLVASVSLTSATVDFANGSFTQFAYSTPTATQTLACGPTRISLAGTTTVYGVLQSSFATGMTAYGLVRARRVR